jgi:hypothetical protein
MDRSKHRNFTKWSHKLLAITIWLAIALFAIARPVLAHEAPDEGYYTPDWVKEEYDAPNRKYPSRS